jgi:lysophospholipase L1-like esterase
MKGLARAAWALALLLAAGVRGSGAAEAPRADAGTAAGSAPPRCELLTGASPAACARLGARGVLHPAPAAFPDARLQARLAHAARRDNPRSTLTVVAFGGSVTAGHGGPPPTYLAAGTYGELFSAWLQRAYAAHDSDVDVVFVNLARPAVSASVPALCAHALLNGTKPDVVLLEFSINADATEWSLLRLAGALAALPSRPILLYVDTFTALSLDGAHGAGWEDAPRLTLPAALGNFKQVALRRLNLTCVSIATALSRDDDRDDASTTDEELRLLLRGAHSEDRIHLSSAGHVVMAELLAQHFATLLRRVFALSSSDAAAFSTSDEGFHTDDAADADAGTCYARGAAPLALLRPSARWSYGHLHGHNKEGWRLNSSGVESIDARAVFALRVRPGSAPADVIAVSAMVNGVRELYGIAELSLDGHVIGTFDGYAVTPFNTQVTRFYRAPAPLPPGSTHALRLRMAPATSSGGHDFALVALMAATDCPVRQPHGAEECMSSPRGLLGGSAPLMS